MPRPRVMDKAKADEILGLLRGSQEETPPPPFVNIAAERAGVPREVVAEWMERGERKERDDCHWFFTEVTKIKAEWIMEKTREILSGQAVDPKATLRILELIDAETFTREKRPAEKPTKKATTNIPLPATMAGMMDELGQKED